MNRFTYFICFAFIQAVTAVAQNPSQEVLFWTRTLHAEPSARVVEMLGDSTKPAWPSIRTAYWIAKLPAPDRVAYQGRADLAKSLLAKLKQGFAVETPATLAELDKEAALYQSAASRIASAEGYTNRLLADCLYRMTLFRLSGWLIKHPDAFDEIAARANRVAVPQPDVSGILARYRVEDPELDKLDINMAAMDPTKSVLHQLKSAGVPDSAGWKMLMEPPASRSSSLIDNPSVVLLLGRIAGTDADHRGLIGMAEYLRRGGKMDAQSINTAPGFRKVMGKDASLYGSRLMEGSPMSMGTLQSFVEMHSPKTPAQNLFVDQLFE